MKPGAAALTLALWAGTAGAEVTALGSGGFSVSHTASVSSGVEATFEAMVGGISGWWLADHTWSGEAARLSITGQAGGCFCEQLPGGGSVEHLRVVYFDPAGLIRMQGGLGPLQGMGLQGTMTWKVTPVDGGSSIEWQYLVHGFLPQGFESIATAVDTVLGLQLASLASKLEKN